MNEPRRTASTVTVCHVIHDLGPGGAEHVLVDLAGEAATAGITMSVVSLMPFGSFEFPHKMRAAGIEVFSLDLLSRWDPRASRRLARLLQQISPDVIHTHLKHADLVGGPVASRLGISHVSTLHVIEDQVTGLSRFKRNAAARSRVKHADITIAVSEAVRSWYLTEFSADPSQVVVIPNGIPPHPPPLPGATLRLRESLGVPKDRLVGTVVALLRPGKGHDVLLKSIEMIPAEIPITVVIVGDGPLMPDLVRSARVIDPDRIVFAGYRDDVPAVLAASDLVIHPTLADALPTSLVHALAAGVPAVASDVGGVREIVTPETGILVRPGEPADLARAIVDLAGDGELRTVMAKASRERFIELFDAATWAARLRNLYESILR